MDLVNHIAGVVSHGATAVMAWVSTHGWYLAVIVFGLSVGATELMARYKDDPFRALRTPSALLYIGVNGLASFFAYQLIIAFDWSFGAETAQKAWMQAFVAGFGSMVFFRSSLFSMRVGQTDVSVGPAILFQVLLFATDRQCDRDRASPRSSLVAEIMRGVAFDQARDALPNFCFELMQNVPISEQQQFRQVVDALASSRMRDNVKVLNLGLMLMNVVGSQVLRAAVTALGEKIQGPAMLDIEVYGKLQTADFTKAFPLLVDLCFIMSRYGSADDQQKAKKAVMDEAQSLVAGGAAADNSSKMTLLGLSLQQRVGDAVLIAALAHVADTIKLTPAANATVPPTGVAPTTVPPVPPTGVDPTKVPPTGVDPATVPPTGVDPATVPPTGVDPTTVPPTGIDPTTVPPTGVDPTTVSQTGVDPTTTTGDAGVEQIKLAIANDPGSTTENASEAPATGTDASQTADAGTKTKEKE